MRTLDFETLAAWAERPDAGWSVGSFGAVGEFVRDPDEPAQVRRGAGVVEVVTARGGLRIAAPDGAPAVAWDSLSADGETWGCAVALCTPLPVDAPPAGVRALGPDAGALREEDADAPLFDLGVGCGAVGMAVRTRDGALVAALRALEDRPLFSAAGIGAEVLRAQPHRVLLSPLARLEVRQPIPPPDGRSPPGPHTHLLPRLLAKGRPHSANTPVPEGWQSALTLHPPSPWRTSLGERRPYDAQADADVAPLLARFAGEEDRAAARAVAAALEGGGPPDAALWPASRRGRVAARIQLRRRHAAGDPRTAAWRARFDRLEPAADAAVDDEPQ